ncbi:ABC transporter substrate-binding protein [Mangrovicoccus sp. HB161399]|uniref:ABC transporter substrate-binding protein n=1 Tax=Mangrovicoccus sp. HB161399 TaxID=2720392 RepID=UPI0015549348|nr:ABC transporter substrate-binding protein [Mangrovicoccus sp. HB161399]
MIRPLPLLALLLSGTAALADRNLTDDTGRAVTVPDHPQRIVVLHEPLLGVPVADLGLPLAGSYGRDDDGGMLLAVDFLASTLGGRAPAEPPKGIGPIGNPDLERLRALQPDLILATEFDGPKADRLAEIAPVYLQNIGPGTTRGIEIEEDLAGVLNAGGAMEARMADYRAALGEARGIVGAEPGQTYLAVFLHDTVNVVNESSGMIRAIEDLGYARLDLAPGTVAPGQSALGAPVSAEAFLRMDPDLLVVLGSYVSGDLSEEAVKAQLGRIAPGWDRFLKPAREGRMVVLDGSKVTTPTVASALNTLAALEDWAGR